MDLLAQIFGATALILNFAFPVDAKYCTYDVEGELRYYICPRNEYCCNFGCCLSPTFQFYQLWYYWLMVIFMFLLCSGGGWWYRYWLQGRYGPELGTSMPPPSSRLHSHHLSHRPARVSYHPSRDAVVLHHIWKPRGLGTGSAFPHASPPPSYACAQRAASVSLPHDSSQTTSGMSNVINTLGPKMSPYYQLYGPPPPYETVINQQPEVHQNTSSDVNSSITEPQLSLPPEGNSSDSAACAAATSSSVCNTAVTINSTNSNDSSNVPAHGEQPVQDSNTSIKNIV